MRHQFIDTISDVVEPGVLYISIEYDTAVHRCACGCGIEVVTPLSPAEWSFTYDGRSISLCPSIGNWNFPCKSHYWIDEGRVRWAGSFSKARIEAVQRQDREDRAELYSDKRPQSEAIVPVPIGDKTAEPASSWIAKLRRRLS